MDTAVKERLVGAAVLVVVVVLVVPALLTGPRPPAEPMEPSSGDTRVVEIDLSGNGRGEVQSGPAEEEEPAGQPETRTEAPAPAPAVAAAPVPAADAAPRKESAPEAVAPEPAPAVAAVPQGGWTVQVAALSKADAAQDMAAGLKKKGYAAFVLEHRSGDRVLYRVRVGPEPQRDRAEALARRLTAEGFKPSVVPPP